MDSDFLKSIVLPVATLLLITLIKILSKDNISFTNYEDWVYGYDIMFTSLVLFFDKAFDSKNIGIEITSTNITLVVLFLFTSLVVFAILNRVFHNYHNPKVKWLCLVAIPSVWAGLSLYVVSKL